MSGTDPAAQKAVNIFNGLAQIVTVTADREQNQLYLGLAHLAQAVADVHTRLDELERSIDRLSKRPPIAG